MRLDEDVGADGDVWGCRCGCVRRSVCLCVCWGGGL